jgi:hypothetical protein
MTDVRYQHRHLDVACELEGPEAQARLGEWERLRETAGLGTELIPGGARLWLRGDAVVAAGDLARREALCCGFLDIELVSAGDRWRLDVTSLVPEGSEVGASLVGIRPGHSPRCC